MSLGFKIYSYFNGSLVHQDSLGNKFYQDKKNAKNVWGFDIKPQIPKKPDIKIFNNFKFNINLLSIKIFKKIVNII